MRESAVSAEEFYECDNCIHQIISHNFISAKRCLVENMLQSQQQQIFSS